jgi:hypothetical protein
MCNEPTRQADDRYEPERSLKRSFFSKLLEAALSRAGFEAPITALQALWALGDRTRSLDLARNRLKQVENPEELRRENERLSSQR